MQVLLKSCNFKFQNTENLIKNLEISEQTKRQQENFHLNPKTVD